MTDTQDALFGDDELREIQVTEPPEVLAGRTAHAIFQRWYEQWYRDDQGVALYAQSEGFIMKELKSALLRGVDAYHLEWAANVLGQNAEPIQAFNLQIALGKIRKTELREMSYKAQTTSNKEYGESL